MPKYYYTDPLKAAWMAREFGVKIYAYINVIGGNNCRIGDVDCKIHKEIDEDPIMYLNPNDCFKNPRTLPYAGWQHAVDKWYIHPDSLHILEPKVGDMCTNCDGEPAIVVPDSKLRRVGQIFLREALEWVGKEAEIIQRDGKAFFMPEVKDDQDA